MQAGMTPNISGNMISNDSGEYLVQVFQYSLNTASDFIIWGTGIPHRAVESVIDSSDPSRSAEPLPGN
jgi:hypothetical protein